MKIKDYWRLAKISLKARKKATKSTVRGIAFSLTIIVPLLFSMIGINQHLNNKLNSVPEQLFATFYSAEKGNKTITEFSSDSRKSWSYDGNSIIGTRYVYADHSKYFDNSELETLHYSVHPKHMENYDNANTLPAYEKITIAGEFDEYGESIDHQVIVKSNDERGARFYSELAVLEEKDHSNLKKYIGKNYVSGCDAGFTGDGKRQVIISEKYLKWAGLKPEDVYQKEISVYFKDASRYNDENIITGDDKHKFSGVLSHHLFQNFKVVGVLKDGEFDNRDIKGVSFIVTNASYYKNGEAVLAPILESKKEHDYTQYNYYIKDIKANEERSSEYVYPGVNYYQDKATVRLDDWSDDTKNGGNNEGIKEAVRVNVYFYQATDYADLEKTIKFVSPEYSKLSTDSRELSGMFGSSVFTEASITNTILTFATLIGGIFGGVVLFAALVNLFNSVKHSVDSRKNYLGVMRAIGAKDATIPKLYFFEVLRIFLKAYIWIAIVGTAICFGIMVALYYVSIYSPLKIVFSWVNIPIVLGVLALLLVIVGLIYSLGCSYSLSKRPITELLEG